MEKYHSRLLEKNYKNNKPGLGEAFYNSKILTMEVIDPFGNRLTFAGIR